MRIVVCARRAASGELNPFDACAYEAALRFPGAEVILLSMAPRGTEEFFAGLTRLGAAKAILLSDPAFAGADTLATAYALSLALKKLSPDLILCGRQTMDGSTAQIPPEIAEMLGIPFYAQAMTIEASNDGISCLLRSGISAKCTLPAIISVERIHQLRLPSIFSQTAPVEILSAADIGADPEHCGLAGSPTRVVQTFENQQDRRHCQFLTPDALKEAIQTALSKAPVSAVLPKAGKKLSNIWTIGSAPLKMAQSIADNPREMPMGTADEICEKIRALAPRAVLWGSDPESRTLAARVAARLGTGLCADCTALETDGEDLYFFRPAFEGNILAKIRCITAPAMGTVRASEEADRGLMLGIGFGAREFLPEIRTLASKLGANLAASRKMVDSDLLPYELQVGLTGRSVHPKVYLALGISGAVHHIAGINRAQTIIAVNSDRNAPIFDFADYGITAPVGEILSKLNSSH